MPGPIVIAIPVRDEEERIAACLTALTAQIGAQAAHIVLLINNTTDGTLAAARNVPMPAGTTLHLLERSLPPPLANAGHARGIAMQEAARLAAPDGILLTTDADGRADPDWLAANLAEIAGGADAVAGWVDLDPVDWHAIPRSLHEDDARECAYDTLCDRIHALLDPDPADPLPRHTQASGASIAVTLAAFHAAGGIPATVSGEDRAFIAALRRADARIRHSPSCHVVVSGRIIGRAAGGMADTIRRRLTASDRFLDARLEPADRCAHRAALRARFRRVFVEDAPLGRLPELTGLRADVLKRLLVRDTFGAAWNDLEGASPSLRHEPVLLTDLPAQMARAAAIVRTLHARQEQTRGIANDVIGESRMALIRSPQGDARPAAGEYPSASAEPLSEPARRSPIRA